MNNQITINKEITNLVNETCYKQYSETMPQTVERIQKLVNNGEHPNKIHSFLLKKYGSCAIAHHLGCVADYFYNLKKSL